MMTCEFKSSSYLITTMRCLDYARHKGKENKVFSPIPLFRNKPVRLVEDWRNLIKIVRTPFGVLLPFVPKKQRALHYWSFRQTVAQQEGNLILTERSEWRLTIGSQVKIKKLKFIKT